MGDREPHAADERQQRGEPSHRGSDRVDRQQVAERDPQRGERQQAEREETERKSEQHRQEQEKIEAAAKKLADEQIQQAVEAAKVETRQEVIAELTAPVESKLVEENEPDAPELYVYPEMPQTAPFAASIAGPPRISPWGQSVIVETHEQRYDREALTWLSGNHGGMSIGAAERLLTAIKAGNVPHVQIVY